MKLRSIAVSLLLAVASGVALADADARGCADHPLFTRMSGFSIFQCKKTYDQLGINIDTNPKSASNLKPEGDLTSIGYIFKKSPEQPSPPSDLQVMRNYQNAAKQKGGEVLVDRPGYSAIKFKRDGGAVYAVVRTGAPGIRRPFWHTRARVSVLSSFHSPFGLCLIAAYSDLTLGRWCCDAIFLA